MFLLPNVVPVSAPTAPPMNAPVVDEANLDRFKIESRFRLPLAPVQEAKRIAQDHNAGTTRRMEAGLDRLLRDIERLEDAERWDGLS